MADRTQMKLFDVPDPPEIKPIRSEIQRRKAAINFRKSETNKSCKHCKHTTYTKEESYKHPRTGRQITYTEYFKCRKCPFIGFSKGEATDIHKGYICDKFEEAKR